MNLWKLEWLRLTRTRRWLALAGVYVFFGITGPLTARYLGEILARFGGDIQVVLPAPVPADGLTQYVSNVVPIGVLIAVVIAAGSLAFDAKPEMGVFLRTRVPNLTGILAPRYLVSTAAVAVSYVLGAAAAWYETVVLIGALPVGGTLAGIAYGVLYLVYVVAVVAAAGSRTSTVLGSVLLTVVVLLGMPIIGIVEALGEWLPSHLVGALDGIPRGAPATDFLRAAGVTLLGTIGALWLAVRWAGAREL